MAQTGSQKSSVSFDCKDGCGEKVTYQREEVLGFVTREKPAAEDKIVYLTCDNGHTYPYTIKGGS